MLETQIDVAIQEIRRQVGDEKVLVLVSGGVDSAVSAALLLKALPADRIYAVHVDHGFMRLHESDEICDALEKMGLVHLKRMDAREFFFDSVLDTEDGPLGPLTTLNDPEKRRFMIGTLFIMLLQQVVEEMGLDFTKTYWAQGTIKPDLLESANPDYAENESRIKTHHNDVDLVREARKRGMVVETNKAWYKEEVRQVALRLGLPEEIAFRQPFPGPGLCVRLMGFDGDETVTENQHEEFRTILTQLAPRRRGEVVPIKTVGVHDNQRSFRNFAVVEGTDCEADWNAMIDLAVKLPNTLDFINRVVYRLNGTGKGYICTPTTISQENIELLRQVDARVSRFFANNRKIAQAFAVLLPMGSMEKPFSVVIRAMVTSDFMTGRPAKIGEEFTAAQLRELVSEIVRDFPQIDCVAYDFTAKPPATVEWM